MKLFGKFSEYSINEILLYSAPWEEIEHIRKTNPNFEVKVQEYKPRKKKIEDSYGNDISKPVDRKYCHQIVLIMNLGFLCLKIYSLPLNAEMIENTGLTSIAAVAQKERTAKAVEKLTGNTTKFYLKI